MKHDKYFPSILAQQRKWISNYKDKIATEGAALGMTAAEIAAEVAVCDAMILAIDNSDSAKNEAKKKVSEKDDAIKGGMDKLRPLIAVHKKNSGYTQGIGEALGVIGSEISFDPSTAKTIVSLSKAPQGVDIKFTLEQCEGGNIYCRRGSETAFTFIKYVIHPHTIDTRPNLEGAAAEQRQYKIILVLNDEEVGIPSDIATIEN
jgi:hypothetical protein